jgi:hypothetical protein
MRGDRFCVSIHWMIPSESRLSRQFRRCHFRLDLLSRDEQHSILLGASNTANSGVFQNRDTELYHLLSKTSLLRFDLAFLGPKKQAHQESLHLILLTCRYDMRIHDALCVIQRFRVIPYIIPTQRCCIGDLALVRDAKNDSLKSCSIHIQTQGVDVPSRQLNTPRLPHHAREYNGVVPKLGMCRSLSTAESASPVTSAEGPDPQDCNTSMQASDLNHASS